MSRPETAKHKVVKTVLIVGEGYSEEYFLKHLASLYVYRGGGVSVTVKNARGMGAAHVVDVAIRQSRNADFDCRAALLDTDVGWNQRTESTARKAHIRVFQSNPCLEALLLQIHQKQTQHKTTLQLKQAFEAAFGEPASALTVFQRHFARETLEATRNQIPTLDALLNLLETGK